MSEPTPILKAVARTSVGGVRTRLELVLTPAEGGALAGLVSVACCPGAAVATLLLRGNELKFFDVVCRKTDRALARAFQMPACDVRDRCCDLVEEMIADIVTGAHPADATVH